ncbi:hypothetical protein EMCG_09383 [[Emmonsia] crescens]|uniref:Uncharacterized protein n=1 Tax=[Emmonsia] crescens TaxID=73230 RepID=A0A0G2J9W9_9EURO|nr:hypothetical protein EMCG_09383 [Emmonsia crescens UAMH 3008]
MGVEAYVWVRDKARSMARVDVAKGHWEVSAFQGSGALHYDWLTAGVAEQNSRLLRLLIDEGDDEGDDEEDEVKTKRRRRYASSSRYGSTYLSSEASN